jgi:hypothetical protein
MPTKAKTRSKPITAVNYVNTLDVWRVTEQLVGDKSSDSASPKTNYQNLLGLLEEIRSRHGMRPAEATIASMAVDLRSDKQLRFVEALGKLGMITDPIDYRWGFVGIVGSRPDEQERSVSSMAPQVAYMLGLLAGRGEVTGDKPEILVVTGVFDIYRSLLDFVQNRGGKAVLVFPRSMLDHRWSWEGLGSPDCSIGFEDLEPHAEKVFGVRLDVVEGRWRLPRSGGLGRV